MKSLLQRDIIRLKTHSFQRTYNWEVLLPNLGLYPGELVAPLIQKIVYSDYEMTEPTAMKHGAFQSFFVNDLTKAPLTMTFLETDTALVKSYFQVWRGLMLTSRTGLWKKKIGSYFSLSPGYAHNIILLYLNAQGFPLREVIFRNAFPLKFYQADLDYNTNDAVKVEIPFACDRIEEGLIGLTGWL